MNNNKSKDTALLVLQFFAIIWLFMLLILPDLYYIILVFISINAARQFNIVFPNTRVGLWELLGKIVALFLALL